MEMTLSIAVQLVSGQADYLVKVGKVIFEIFLLAADRTMHKLLAMCSALTSWFWLTNVYNQRQRFWQLEFVNQRLRASRLPML